MRGNIPTRWLFLIAAAVCLMAADPVWMSKPPAQWTEEDAG